MAPTVSVLVASRKNSKYLAHFILGFFEKTADLANTELLVMANSQDTWNKDLFQFFAKQGVKFFFEDSGLGRWGHHEYFNALAKEAKGEWLVVLCEDMEFLLQGWDEKMLVYVQQQEIDANKIYILYPRMEVAGAVVQVVSHGFYDVLGYISLVPSVDSWINTLGESFPSGRTRDIPRVFFKDYTPIYRDTLGIEQERVAIDPLKYGKIIHFGSLECREMLKAEADHAKKAISGGR